MIIPIIPEHLFETGKFTVKFENDVIVVDNWYKNYDQILQVTNNIPVSRWKHEVGGRNFIDYYDCRPIIPIHFPTQKIADTLNIIGSLIQFHFKETEMLVVHNDPYAFNYYKNIKKDVSSNLQQYPHVDFRYNCIVYLDEVSSGGTAIYDMEPPVNNEHLNLLYDVSGIEKIVVPAKPNRLVIFKGNRVHGGYIEDHNAYVDNWRINHVMFMEAKK